MGKHSKVFSSTKWGFGENVVLRLMEFLTPSVGFDIFIDNYFTSFVSLPTLEVTAFEQQVCSTKTSYVNVLSVGANSCKKKELANFEQRTSNKIVVG